MEEVKDKIHELGEHFNRSELLELKEKMGDASAEEMWTCARLAIKHYADSVEMAIFQGKYGAAGSDQSAADALNDAHRWHHESYACTQIIGMIMEKARGEQ